MIYDAAQVVDTAKAKRNRKNKFIDTGLGLGVGAAGALEHAWGLYGTTVPA